MAEDRFQYLMSKAIKTSWSTQEEGVEKENPVKNSSSSEPEATNIHETDG